MCRAAGFAKLRLYQWTGIAGMLFGIFLAMIPHWRPVPVFEFNYEVVAIPLCLSLVAAFAMDADFPASNRRFSRLYGQEQDLQDLRMGRMQNSKFYKKHS